MIAEIRLTLTSPILVELRRLHDDTMITVDEFQLPDNFPLNQFTHCDALQKIFRAYGWELKSGAKDGLEVWAERLTTT